MLRRLRQVFCIELAALLIQTLSLRGSMFDQLPYFPGLRAADAQAPAQVVAMGDAIRNLRRKLDDLVPNGPYIIRFTARVTGSNDRKLLRHDAVEINDDMSWPATKMIMTERIKLRDRRSRAYWSRRLRCTDTELLEAVRATHSIDTSDIGIYLITRRALEAFKAPRAA